MDNDELLIAIKDMFEKKVEEVKDEVQDVKRYTGMLFEDLRKDVKAIAEGHSILDSKIDNLQKELTETKKELTGTRRELTGTRQELKADINGLRRDIEVVKDYVIGVDTKLNEHDVILKRVK